MSTRAVTPAASAAANEIETPGSLEEAIETGFLPDDPHYRLTGEFKSADKEEPSAGSAKTEKEKPSEKEEASAASGAQEHDADTAAASAAADTQEKKAAQKTSATSESRWAKITRENKELKERLARAEAAKPATEPTRDTKQASQPAAEATSTATAKPKIDDVDAKTGQPKYKTYADYDAAKDEWLQSEAIRKFTETSQKTQREQQQQQAEVTLAQGFAKKLEPTRAKYADFDTVALGDHVLIPKGSVTDVFLLDSDHAGEVLYHLGQHPEITKSFYGNWDGATGKYTNTISPQRQFRKLMEIEATFSGTKSGKSSGEETPPAKSVTQAPRPPHQVSGKGTVAKDAVEQAVEDGDSEAYIREANARALARLNKGK